MTIPCEKENTQLRQTENEPTPQKTTRSALIFLYREVLKQDLVGSIDSVHAKRPKRLPTVLTKEETLRVFGFLSGTRQLVAKLLYGSGLRLIKCVRLRVKDVDFAQRQPASSHRTTLLAHPLVRAVGE